MGKNILIFSDGTGQAGGVRPEQRLSNVYKIYDASRICPENPISPTDQVAFYDAGLGTDLDVSGGLTQAKRFIGKFLGSVTGRGITSNITDCYEAILNYYEPGDRVFLFGFSRGAYTARCVASVLALCGVPTTDADGNPLPRFSRQTRKIADEAVRKVYEHGAGLRRDKFQAERDEKARRFREKYGAEENDDANVVPYFIGVFDTVASLGAKGVVRGVMLLVALLGGVGVSMFLAALSTLLFGMDYWSSVLIAGLALGIWVVWRTLSGSLKTIGHYPKRGRFRFHFAKWRMKNYDRGLDPKVPYTRHALAIDEARKDFDRVKWGDRSADYSRGPDEPDGFIQMWFAGNHSDIGGSYPENESRLSDIALNWMLEEVQDIPNPLIVNPGKLNIYPSAGGIQHCEVYRVRHEVFGWLPKNWRPSWPEKHRYAASGAVYHPSVNERLGLPCIIKHGRAHPYRPPALKFDPALKDLYPPKNPSPPQIEITYDQP